MINYIKLYPLKTKKNKAFTRFVELHKKIMNKEHLNIKGINEIENLITLRNKHES